MDNLDAGQHRARCGDSRQVCAECEEEQPRFPRLEASPAPYATRIFCVQRFAVHAAPFFRFHFFFFPFFLKRNLRLALSPETTGADTFAKITPAPLVHSSVGALPSAYTLRPAPAVAARLNASGSEDSHRGPYQQA
jgi:hypothetical protein